ncbi:unnamed protein product [Paramecium sonneborni]|uniref:Uncharacterized protein n=1 Tax=Paramecium sonneborni TaxID=65129 RepID=A0A8S1JTA1_9CILI|nr:unnamed protein product [Paramecium sonneborni]
MIFLILFLGVCYEVIGNEVLFASSFTTNDFTTNEGWVFYSRRHTDSGISAFENQNYIGLNTLSGAQFQGDGLIKFFYELPPHYAVRIKGTLLFKITWFFEYNEGQIIVDGKVSMLKTIIKYKQQLIPEQIHLKSDFDILEYHYTTTIVIQVYFGSSYLNDDSTLGFRDFQLFILKCPNGCESCDNEFVCNDWKLQYRSLQKIQFMQYDTEGWSMSSKFDNLDKNSYISIERCQNQNIDMMFFGLGKLNQQITKMIELPLHYKVKISYLQLLYDILYRYNYNWMIEVDGSIIMTKNFQQKLKPPHICNYVYDPLESSGDLISNINFDLSHQKQFLNFATYPTDYIFSDQTVKWAIRDFEIYIKKCHNSCIYGCRGPSAQDCQDDILYKLFQFYSTFTETTFIYTDGWQMIKPNQLTSKRCMESIVSTNTNFFQGNNYFQKVYYLTQTHTQISISFTFYQIDKFTGEKLFILVDDIEVKQVSLLALTNFDGLPLCSVDDDYDTRIIVNITNIAHSQNTLIVQIYTNQISTATGFWGIRNFALTLDKKLYSSEFTNLNLINDDWKDWVFTPLSFDLSLCSAKTLFGGTSSLDQTSSLRKIIKNIPEHQKIHIYFKIFIKAPADQLIQLTFYIDGLQVFNKYLKTQTMLFCDASTNSNFYTIEEIYPHLNSQVFLQIITANSENIAYTWGIRDFKLNYYSRYIYSG